MLFKHRAFLSCLLVLLLAAAFGNLASCGGGSAKVVPAGITPPPTPALEDQTAPERNTLTTTMPALGTLKTGQEFDFVIHCALVDELFQASARVLYDPQVVQPLTVGRGAMVPGGAVFLARCDVPVGTLPSPASGLPGVIPCAFTGRPGESGLAAGRGELLRIRFRITGTPRGGCVQLQNDEAFLQLRDRQGQRLAFDLATEEVSQ